MTQADAICERAASERGSVRQPTNLSAIGPYAAKVADLTGNELRDLKSLALPQKNRRVLNAMLSALEAAQRAGNVASQQSTAGNASATQTALAHVRQDFDLANAKARVYGLSACAQH